MGLRVERNTCTGKKNCFDTKRALADQSGRCIVVIGTINRPPFRYSRMFDRGSKPTLLRCPQAERSARILNVEAMFRVIKSPARNHQT